MTSSKQTKGKSKSKKTKASLIPLAVGVGVGALSGVAMPYQDGQTQVIKAHAEETTPSLPKEGANFMTEMGDVSNYNLVTNASSVQFYNGNRWVSATLPNTVFDIKPYNGSLYATSSDKYTGTILKYNEEGRFWDKVGETPEPIYDLIITKDGKFISGGGAPGTYGTDFGIYSSLENDSSWQTRVSGYKSNSSNGIGNNLGIFYTGVDTGNSILMFGTSGNWTFIHSSPNGKDFSYKQEIYGGYNAAITGNGKTVAIGTQVGTSNALYGSIATSNEGGAFTVKQMSMYDNLNNIAFGNDTFVIVGSGNNGSGLIYTSKDGVNWTKATVSSKSLSDIAWDEVNKRFVAVGASGTMLVSLDGQKWVSVNTGLTSNITNIEFNSNKQTAYDVAYDALMDFNKNLNSIGFKTFNADEKAKYKEELQKIVDEKVEAVINETGKKKLKDNLVSETNKKIDGMHLGYLRYNEFVELKKEIEGMPSTTSEEVSAQVSKINKFETTLIPLDPLTRANLSSELNEYRRPFLLKEATLLVEKAEKTFVKSDYQLALDKVNVLLVDDTQKGLKNRLFALQSILPYKQAERMIEIAEKSLLEADYNKALAEMNNLNSGPEKNKLLNRLDWILVNMADNLLKQYKEKTIIIYDEYSKFDVLYNKITPSNKEVLPERIRLNDEKNVLQMRMYISNLKTSYSDTTLGYVDTLYKNIPATSPYKEMYKNDYLIVSEMKKYPKETSAIQNWIRWKTVPYHIENGTKALNSLPEGILKDYFKQVLGLGTNYAKEAETLLTELEKTFSLEKVTTIQNSISKVTDAKVKEDLTNRLNQAIEKENVRVAEEAVTKAEQTPSNELVKTAKEAIEKINTETTKTELTNRLEEVVETLKTAEATVALTELMENPSEEAYTNAVKLIEEIKNEEKRVEMKEQADKALETYKVLVATEAVKTAQTELTKDAYTNAEKAIEELKEGQAKENLSLALANVLETMKTNDAKDMMIALKANPNQEELDKVASFVNELKDSESKTELLNDLVTVQDSINLENAKTVVENVKSNPTQEAVTEALKIVNELKDSETKTQLINTLEMIQDAIDLEKAQKMVTNVEENPTQENVTETFKVVNELKNSDAKTELINKLVIVQDAINLKKAQDIVANVKANPTQEAVTEALKIVNELKEGEQKTQLVKEIGIVQDGIYLENAKKLVDKAVEELTQDSVDKAKKAIALVKPSTDKVELEKKLQLVQDIVSAKPVRVLLQEFEVKLDAINKRPKSSEAQALTNEYNEIAKKVYALNNGTVKTELVEDLKDVKETLDAVIKNGNHPNKPKSLLHTIIHWVITLVFGR